MGGDSGPAVVQAVNSVPLAEKRLDALRRKAATLPGEEALLKQASADLQGREKGIIDAPTAQQAQAQLVEIIQKVAKANGFDVKGVESMPQPNRWATTTAWCPLPRRSAAESSNW